MARSWFPSNPLQKEELRGKRIGVPGLKTTAYLTLKLFEPDFEAVVHPFDKILDAVQAGAVDAGLLIHEGQLIFPKMGLHRVIDLGVWWMSKHPCHCRWAGMRFAAHSVRNLAG